MSDELILHRNRTNIIRLGLGMDVSLDTITSEVKAEIDPDADPLVTFDVTFDTDGTDGELILTVDDEDVSAVTQNYGWMDLKRVSGGEPLSVFLEPLRVKFQGVVTT